MHGCTSTLYVDGPIPCRRLMFSLGLPLHPIDEHARIGPRKFQSRFISLRILL